MDLVDYLLDVYGYGTPIFLKDLRIGGKSKSAIREELYRAVKRGDICREAPGIFSIVDKEKEFPEVVTFEDIVERYFLYSNLLFKGNNSLFVEGYYTGMTFLNQIGISEQVPAVLEITTNRTSSKKRMFSAAGRFAIIRKGKTEITFQNYKMLQFLDMFYFLASWEVIEHKELLIKYIKDNHLTKQQFTQYISLYSDQTLKKITEGGIISAFI